MRGFPAAAVGGLIMMLTTWTPAAAGVPPPPRVPPNFLVEAFARDLDPIHALLVLPGGDVLVAAGDRVSLMRDSAAAGVADSQHVLVAGLDHPVGLALRRDKLYVATADGIQACRYLVGRVRLAGACHRLANLQGEGTPVAGGLAFDRDETVLYVAVDGGRAAPSLLAMRADGKGRHVVTNSPAGLAALALEPGKGGLWALDRGHSPATLVPVGAAAKATGLPLPATPVALAFYGRDRYPRNYRGGLFVADLGSADGTVGVEPRLLFAPFTDGLPTGAIEEFGAGLSPGALAVTRDGALLVADNSTRTLWRVAFKCGACTPDPVPPHQAPAAPRKH